MDDLDKLKEVKIERCFKPKRFGKIEEIRSHLFSEGSLQGYSAAVCLWNVWKTSVYGYINFVPSSWVKPSWLLSEKSPYQGTSVNLNHIIREELEPDHDC